jgi:hypothetical protein
MTFSIFARVSSRDPHISPRHSQGMIAGTIWKRSCINLFIIYFRQIVLWNKQTKRINWMNLYGSLSVYSTDTFSEQYSQSRSSLPPININGNISYEGILKHRKYRCDSLVSFFFSLIYRELWLGNYPWIVFIQNHFTFSEI